MATDAEAAGEGAEESAAEPRGEAVDEASVPGAGSAEGASETAPSPGLASAAAEAEDAPYFVEIWNDYDPSMRFAAIFPVGEKEGAAASAVGYYIIEPGKHTGLHSDNAEEVVFVAEGEGEAFMMGGTRRLEPGKFVVFPPGLDHDVYAQGAVALRILSFFPTVEIVSTFQQVIFPMGGNVLSSTPPSRQAPVLTELDPNNLPDDFPFSLEELGMAEPGKPRELTRTERLLGMTEPDKPPAEVVTRVIDPKNPDENLAEEHRSAGEEPEEHRPAEEEPEDGSGAGEQSGGE